MEEKEKVAVEVLTEEVKIPAENKQQKKPVGAVVEGVKDVAEKALNL
ncbi:MAG: hypothetical protein IJI66_05760 [Erysipelotrichaceae bacterium]|nr:hypothetical protein [Erysipelotrichaceae bacterium]